MRRYFNDNEPFVCDWLENLWPGAHVDRRSIRDIQPAELAGYDRAHFFAGIGGWEYALDLAGWPADLPVWSGSCPCQPFSAAGKQEGEADERHLWPELRRLIAECRPPVVFGEQVASRLGRAWLAGVRTDLEALGYAVGAADLCAAGVGAPHIRQRLYWVAYAGSGGVRRRVEHRGDARLAGEVRQQRLRPHAGADGSGVPPGRMADTLLTGRAEGRSIARDGSAPGRGVTRGVADADGGLTRNRDVQRGGQHGLGAQDGGVDAERVGDTHHAGLEGHGRYVREHGAEGREAAQRHPGAANAWADAIWLPCTDGKARRIEPGAFPLAHGVPARVGRLRAYGNAIVPQVAAAFVTAFMEATGIVPASERAA